MSGKWHNKIRQLHEQYGPVIRIGPDELSYATPDAWDDIYGRYVPARRKENPKPAWYCSPDAHDMVGANLGDHGRMRKVMGPGFTYGAMCRQEPLIREHVDLFLSRLHELADGDGAVVNMLDWFTYCTFDLIGDLAFGEPFGCLKNSMLHPWLQLVFANIYVTHILMLCKRLPVFCVFLPIKTTVQLYRDFKRHVVLLREVVDRRIARTTQRDDFMDVMTSSSSKSLYMTKEEVFKNAILLTGGGAETTSGSLTGMAYHLATRPDVKAKVVTELREVFKTEEDINMRSVAALDYTGAFIEEAMRYYPPGPNAMWRITPEGGNTILGETIPEKVELFLFFFFSLVLFFQTTNQTGLRHRLYWEYRTACYTDPHATGTRLMSSTRSDGCLRAGGRSSLIVIGGMGSNRSRTDLEPVLPKSWFSFCFFPLGHTIHDMLQL